MSNAEWGCCRRKRSTSKGSDFVSDMKSEEQSNTCHRDDREPSAMETGRTPTYRLTYSLFVYECSLKLHEHNSHSQLKCGSSLSVT